MSQIESFGLVIRRPFVVKYCYLCTHFFVYLDRKILGDTFFGNFSTWGILLRPIFEKSPFFVFLCDMCDPDTTYLKII